MLGEKKKRIALMGRAKRGIGKGNRKKER